MKNFFLILLSFVVIVVFSTNVSAQDKSAKKIVVKRFLVERTFPKGLNLPVNEKGCQIVRDIISNNSDNHVTWIYSFVSADKKKTFCIYDGPVP
jgi:Nickel responsive protein SCO4226-like